MLRRAAVSTTLLVALSLASAAQASEAVDNLWTSLSMWRPLDVTMGENGSVRVVLDQAEVPEIVYVSVIKSGICMYVTTRDWKLAGVDEIAILNETGDQGYIFEGGADACEKLQGPGDTAAQPEAIRKMTRPF